VTTRGRDLERATGERLTRDVLEVKVSGVRES
jgi:hypothetical protein